jgi:hypothetical protein
MKQYYRFYYNQSGVKIEQFFEIAAENETEANFAFLYWIEAILKVPRSLVRISGYEIHEKSIHSEEDDDIPL